VRAVLDERGLQLFLESNVIPALPAPQNLTLRTLPEDDEVRAETEGEMRDGWVIDMRSAARMISENVRRGLLSNELIVREVKGRIRNMTGKDIGEMEVKTILHEDGTVFDISVYGFLEDYTD